jgi:hypothetical protein
VFTFVPSSPSSLGAFTHRWPRFTLASFCIFTSWERGCGFEVATVICGFLCCTRTPSTLTTPGAGRAHKARNGDKIL